MSEQQQSKPVPKLIVRNAVPADIAGIRALMAKAYPSFGPHGVYTEAQLRGQMHQFPEGQFVANYEGQIVGYCATFRIPEALALSKHDWATITGRGYASRHDPAGRLALRHGCLRRSGVPRPAHRPAALQRAQAALPASAAQRHRVRRPHAEPGAALEQVGSAEKYLELVLAGKQRDPVIGFQIRNGFEPIGVLHDYLPIDHRVARPCHAHDLAQPPGAGGTTTAPARVMRRPQTVRVAAVQYELRAISSFEEFAHQVEYFVDAVADYKADFAVFPELFTLQLLSIENRKVPAAEAIAALTSYTGRFKEMMSELAVGYNVNIIGGSHPTREPDGEVYNISYVFLRDGSVYEQYKMHPTPNERYWWNIRGGERVNAIETDCGPIGVPSATTANSPSWRAT